MKAISRYIYIIILVFIICPKVGAQTVTFEKLPDLQASENRIVMVFIKTKWCIYCNSMENSMLNNPYISGLIKKKFYYVLLDGEEKQTIQFAGRSFRFKPAGKNTGVHELATALGTVDGQVSYPAICFLNSKNEIIYQHAGYLKPAALIKVLEAVSD